MFRYLRRLIMDPPKNVITIVGTTGVGKSQFSIELAKRLNGEVINADSMQMYQGIDTISNKHPMDERFGIPHHVMNHVNWDEEYFVHRFEQEAMAAIDDIHSRGKIPIIIGGTHYYLQNVLFKNRTIKTDQETEQQENKLTPEELDILDGPPDIVYKNLVKYDPLVAQKFHPNDTRRVRRALEIYFLTKTKTSDIYNEQRKNESEGSSLRYRSLVFWVYSDQQILDKRLDDRVDSMINGRAIEEIQELYEYYQNLPETPDCEHGVWQVIGFKEFLPWLNESGSSEDERKLLFQMGIDEMKMRTRRYARRQTKWIQKTLVPELWKEKNHGFVNGGEPYLLDASDLSFWDKNVSERGCQIAENFVGVKDVSHDYTPKGLEKVIEPPQQGFDKKDLANWQHFTCDICKNTDGTLLIAVGESQWKDHLKSRRHNSTLHKGKRKREYEEWLAKQEKNIKIEEN